MCEFKGVVSGFPSLRRWWRGVGRGVKEKKLEFCHCFVSPLFLVKNLIPSNLELIALVSHAFSGVLMHLLDF